MRHIIIYTDNFSQSEFLKNSAPIALVVIAVHQRDIRQQLNKSLQFVLGKHVVVPMVDALCGCCGGGGGGGG